MKNTKKKIKILTLILIAIAILSNNAFGQWGVNGNDIYNNNIGKLGISPAGTFTNPSYQIDCKGDININTTTSQAYRIQGNKVLWYNGNATDNIYAGVGAGSSIATGSGNAFFGYNAGANNDDNYNTLIGALAGLNSTSGYSNVYVGFEAGALSTSAHDNTFLGIASGYNTSIGVDNVFIGAGAGNSNGSGSFNTISGWAAGALATVGVAYYNSFYGYMSGTYNKDGSVNSYYGSLSGNQFSDNDNDSNVFVGHKLGYNNEGDANAFMGVSSGLSNSTGTHNSFFGSYAGENSTDGDLNTYLGFRTRAATGLTINNSTALGSNSEVATDNTIILGDNSVNTGIGISGNTIGPLAKLHVQRDIAVIPVALPTSLYVSNEDVADPTSGTLTSIGINNRTFGLNFYNYGMQSDVSNAYVNYSGFFTAITPAHISNTGLFGGAQDAPYNFAVYGYAPKYKSGVTVLNVAIYGEAPQIGIPSNITTNVGSWAGYFNGDIAHTGLIVLVSDSTVKKNIKIFTKANSILSQIKCYTFNYDSTKYGDHIHLSTKKQYGFLAQQIESVLPNLVVDGGLPPKIDSLGNIIIPAQSVKMVDYEHMAPLLVAGHNEQQVIIDSLNTRLTNLEALVANCCSQQMRNANPNTSGENERNQIKLENSTACILYQNQPNPYSTSTVIRFFIPENLNDVKITFQDNTGKTLKEVEIKQTGQGSLEVNGSELSTGIYTYSLVVGGKVIDTKKMMKQ